MEFVCSRYINELSIDMGHFVQLTPEDTEREYGKPKGTKNVRVLEDQVAERNNLTGEVPLEVLQDLRKQKTIYRRFPFECNQE